MKKIIGLLFYTASLLTTIWWLYGIWELLNPCKNCPTLAVVMPWWKNPQAIGFMVVFPIIALILFKIGSKLRK